MAFGYELPGAVGFGEFFGRELEKQSGSRLHSVRGQTPRQAEKLVLVDVEGFAIRGAEGLEPDHRRIWSQALQLALEMRGP